MMTEIDFNNLPHPEDITNEIELIGLYIRVYMQFVKVSTAITARISGNLDQDRRLGKIAEMTEAPLERWLNLADEFLPDWFDGDLLLYPEIKPDN